MSQDSPLVLTPSEAAEQLGISRTKVYELIASGELPTITIGRRRRVPVVALKAWIERNTVCREEVDDARR